MMKYNFITYMMKYNFILLHSRFCFLKFSGFELFNDWWFRRETHWIHPEIDPKTAMAG